MKNFGTLSKEKWKEFVYNNSCLLRLVRHDTVPMSNAEFMMAGRPVISNIEGECTHYIDTKGTSEINKWDLFQPGFLTDRWAETKKKIIQDLRKIKNSTIHPAPLSNYGLKERFDREKYINKIYELCDLKRRTK
jgi:hypothetical protein